MRAELELGDHPEVAAAAAQPPEQVGVLIGAGAHDTPVGENDLGGQQRVDGQTEAAHEPPDAATEGQAADAGVRDNARGDDEPVLLGASIDRTEGRTTADPYRAGRRVDLDAIERAQIEHDPAVHG